MIDTEPPSLSVFEQGCVSALIAKGLLELTYGTYGKDQHSSIERVWLAGYIYEEEPTSSTDSLQQRVAALGFDHVASMRRAMVGNAEWHVDYFAEFKIWRWSVTSQVETLVSPN